MDLLQKVAILVLLSVRLVDLSLAQPLLECGRLTGGVASGSAPAAQKDDTNDPAIDACRAALKASPNDPGSMFQLGRSLSAGSKHREAIRHFLDAADRGHVGAMTELGLVFEYGRGVPRNLATALAWYEKAAEGGDPQAMIELGRWSASGTGVDLDLATAKAWYEKAAAIGNASAMNQLGVFYEEGRGVPQNLELAWEWYAKAAKLNLAKAMAHLGQLSENGRGVQANVALARRWYEKAVALGDPDAMAYLGALFERGHGVSPNLTTARDLYDKGAALGSALAMANLATLFQEGRGIPQDLQQARFWHERAAALGLPRAVNALGQLYLTGRGGPKNFDLANELFEKAAALGDGAAMNNIGLLYLNGGGVERDEVRPRLGLRKRRRSATRTRKAICRAWKRRFEPAILVWECKSALDALRAPNRAGLFTERTLLPFATDIFPLLWWSKGNVEIALILVCAFLDSALDRADNGRSFPKSQTHAKPVTKRSSCVVRKTGA